MTTNNIEGQKFGMWTVGIPSKRIGKVKFVWCQCDCGSEKWVRQCDIKNGKSKSCGCDGSRAKIGLRRKTHGHSVGFKESPTYSSWTSMLTRVRNSKRDFAHIYHGMVLDPRWLKFENFLADMGERPEGKTLDRKNGDRGYEPGNCRWATNLEQAQNTSRNVHVFFQGDKVVQGEAARRLSSLKGVSFWSAMNFIRKIRAASSDECPEICPA